MKESTQYDTRIRNLTSLEVNRTTSVECKRHRERRTTRVDSWNVRNQGSACIWKWNVEDHDSGT